MPAGEHLSVLNEKTRKAALAIDPTVPAGMWRDPKDGALKFRPGRPRNGVLRGKGPKPNNKFYNLLFSRGGRRYRVTFTSQSSPDVFFQVEYTQTSLRTLLSELAYHIGKACKPDCTQHFTVSFEALTNMPNMVETMVAVVEGEERQGIDIAPSTLGAVDDDMEEN